MARFFKFSHTPPFFKSAGEKITTVNHEEKKPEIIEEKTVEPLKSEIIATSETIVSKKDDDAKSTPKKSNSRYYLAKTAQFSVSLLVGAGAFYALSLYLADLVIVALIAAISTVSSLAASQYYFFSSAKVNSDNSVKTAEAVNNDTAIKPANAA